jgi:hypothetical protein
MGKTFLVEVLGTNMSDGESGFGFTSTRKRIQISFVLFPPFWARIVVSIGMRQQGEIGAAPQLYQLSKDYLL